MKFETVILGGGLSGLVSGIALAKSGRKVAIVSSGQSALHFSSGSFELLGRYDGYDVPNPMEVIPMLPSDHIYSKIGIDNIAQYLKEVKTLFAEAGIKISGSEQRNHYRMTPFGIFKPAWLTIDDYLQVADPDELPWKRVAIINLRGYLDFYPKFIASNLIKKGVKCTMKEFTLPVLETLRKSSSEMRAANIARVLTGSVLDSMADEINRLSADAEVVLMPAVMGLYDSTPVEELRERVDKPLYLVPTTPASVPGVRTQIQLRNYFQRLGGTYLLGDNVKSGKIENGMLKSVATTNLGDEQLYADNFILATGSFFSHGLIAAPNRIYEPIFGLDVNAREERSRWFDKDVFKAQPYMKFGVSTDVEFHAMLNGEPISNLYAAGAVVGGVDALKESAGAGTTIASSLHVAHKILKL